ncbi:metal-dependent hydrolase [Mycobacteroides chelonae]|jgi:uncharacterized protein|uniref:metal-dependent hydrolase n=1 Tax=Mycobacteroides chelonae TaxID=1774 RepID=UPI0009925341|nr:metal-dependent hydrolase [Mycobacteroides chelonae]
MALLTEVKRIVNNATSKHGTGVSVSAAPGEDRVAVRARNIEFDISDSPLHWIPGDPIASHGASIFNFFLPVGERWFCAVYERALPFVNDDKVREDMLGFIGQEATHAQTHDHILHYWFDQHGITYAKGFVTLTEWAEQKIYPLFDKLSGNALLWVLKPQICAIAIIEHLTAYYGDFILNCHEWDRRGADPVIRDLYRWHGAEEIEHRFVAYDVAEYFGIKRYQKNIAAILAAILYEPILLFAMRALVKHDPALPKMGYLRLIREWRGAARRGTLPPFGTMLRQLPHLLSKSYSPARVGNTAQAVAYLAQSPAARAFAA